MKTLLLKRKKFIKTLEYQGYTGSIEYSQEDQLFFGKILGKESLISYEGDTGPELEADFISTLEEYLHNQTKKQNPMPRIRLFSNIGSVGLIYQMVSYLEKCDNYSN